jgi:hypothetical protein
MTQCFYSCFSYLTTSSLSHCLNNTGSLDMKTLIYFHSNLIFLPPISFKPPSTNLPATNHLKPLKINLETLQLFAIPQCTRSDHFCYDLQTFFFDNSRAHLSHKSLVASLRLKLESNKYTNGVLINNSQ